MKITIRSLICNVFFAEEYVIEFIPAVIAHRECIPCPLHFTGIDIREEELLCRICTTDNYSMRICSY